MKFCTNVPHINMSRIHLTSLCQNGGHKVILCRKVLCCHLGNENETSAALVCRRARQFLIYSTFIFVSYRQHCYVFLHLRLLLILRRFVIFSVAILCLTIYLYLMSLLRLLLIRNNLSSDHESTWNTSYCR